MNMNRKRFIEISSSLTGSVALLATMPWISAFQDAEPAGLGPSDRVRLGFIGVGARGRTLLLNVQDFQERLNVEIVAVCDNYPPHLERAKELTGGYAEGFLDYREMLEKVKLDAVIIATPLHLHVGPTLAAFEAGIHVFCEKAMARTLEDVKLMYDKHVEYDRILVIGHQRLFSPVYLEAIDRIRQGEYGQITMIKGHWHRNTDWIHYKDIEPGSALDRQRNWRLYKESSGGMITELCSHHLQVSNWVMGEQPVSVIGSGSINYWKDHREVWDNFSLVFRYADGTHFNYSCLQSNKHNGMQIQALGKKGMVDLEVNKQFMVNPPAPPAIRKLIHSIESNLFDVIPIGGATWVPAEPVTYGGDFITNNWEMNETQLLLEAFVEYVRKGRAPEKLTIEGYNASTWSLLAEKATMTGEKVELPKEYFI
jgi:predicted dehydrogenase